LTAVAAGDGAHLPWATLRSAGASPGAGSPEHADGRALGGGGARREIASTQTANPSYVTTNACRRKYACNRIERIVAHTTHDALPVLTELSFCAAGVTTRLRSGRALTRTALWVALGLRWGAHCETLTAAQLRINGTLALAAGRVEDLTGGRVADVGDTGVVAQHRIRRTLALAGG
jgi:hypothetical protein